MSKKHTDLIYKLEQVRKGAQTLTKEKLEKRAKAKYSQDRQVIRPKSIQVFDIFTYHSPP